MTVGANVFLAGATGLVGSAILRALLESDPKRRVRAAYHAREPLFRDPRVDYVRADLTLVADCRRAVEGCDSAIMAAAADAAGAGGLVGAPWNQVTANAVMNAQMLDAFHGARIKRAIYVGSVTLYQEFDGVMAEDGLDLNLEPHPAYRGIGWVHRANEKLCRFWHDSTGIEILIARSDNVFGPFARFDPQNANFIPAIIRKAVDKMEPFEVWGSPGVTRDVIFADDFARAIVLMLQARHIAFDVFNIGSGVRTTVGQVVEWALRHAGHHPREVVYASDRPTTDRVRALDCSKAQRMLNWRPAHTVEEGVARTTRWWIENREWWRK